MLRYWDGRAWTDHVHPGSIHPTPATSATTAIGGDTRWWQSWWFIVPALLLFFPMGLVALWRRPVTTGTVKWLVTGGTALLVALALALPSDGSENPASPPTANGGSASGASANGGATGDEATTDAASETPSSAPTPTTAAVPRLVGMDRSEAREALRQAGLKLGVIQNQPSARTGDSVLRQGIKAGTEMSLGSTVDLIVAAPLPAIPDVVGATRTSALNALGTAGFAVRVSIKTTTSGADDVILSESPTGGSRAKSGTTVTLVVSDVHRPLTLSSGGGGSCTPGYSPCLAPKSDYDCSGGSGDGPGYTGLVHVTGSDPYDLDRDGDGIGCD